MQKTYQFNSSCSPVPCLATAPGSPAAASPSPDPSGGEAKTGSQATAYTIGMSQCNLGEPWRVQMNADIRKPPRRSMPN